MAPFGLSAEYKRKHPLGKIPLLEVDGRPLPDSSAICAYLEKIQPQPALYPSDPFDYARAIWFEEFADGGLINGAVPFFQQRVLEPLFFKRPGDEALVQKAATETLPPLFDYLEAGARRQRLPGRQPLHDRRPRGGLDPRELQARQGRDRRQALAEARGVRREDPLAGRPSRA